MFKGQWFYKGSIAAIHIILTLLQIPQGMILGQKGFAHTEQLKYVFTPC